MQHGEPPERTFALLSAAQREKHVHGRSMRAVRTHTVSVVRHETKVKVPFDFEKSHEPCSITQVTMTFQLYHLCQTWQPPAWASGSWLSFAELRTVQHTHCSVACFCWPAALGPRTKAGPPSRHPAAWHGSVLEMGPSLCSHSLCESLAPGSHCSPRCKGGWFVRS